MEMQPDDDDDDDDELAPHGPHLLTQRFSLMGTVLTKVIMRTPLPSCMVMALLLGSMALAVTGTLSTAVQSHILFTGLLWMLQRQNRMCERSNMWSGETASGMATGTLPTAVQSHILFTGLLWMLQQQKWRSSNEAAEGANEWFCKKSQTLCSATTIDCFWWMLQLKSAVLQE
jgi:hypothetical protein